MSSVLVYHSDSHPIHSLCPRNDVANELRSSSCNRHHPQSAVVFLPSSSVQHMHSSQSGGAGDASQADGRRGEKKEEEAQGMREERMVEQRCDVRDKRSRDNDEIDSQDGRDVYCSVNSVPTNNRVISRKEPQQTANESRSVMSRDLEDFQHVRRAAAMQSLPFYGSRYEEVEERLTQWS